MANSVLRADPRVSLRRHLRANLWANPWLPSLSLTSLSLTLPRLTLRLTSLLLTALLLTSLLLTALLLTSLLLTALLLTSLLLTALLLARFWLARTSLAFLSRTLALLTSVRLVTASALGERSRRGTQQAQCQTKSQCDFPRRHRKQTRAVLVCSLAMQIMSPSAHGDVAFTRRMPKRMRYDSA